MENEQNDNNDNNNLTNRENVENENNNANQMNQNNNGNEANQMVDNNNDEYSSVAEGEVENSFNYQITQSGKRILNQRFAVMSHSNDTNIKKIPLQTAANI
ncbi:hypothetical protein QE152_g28429 [Popillia japonica]|uniref:Uncharacterized protein n=1 Tax=Popillia japonica TaxID=7064 RepID=A0AAW1JJV8_POPJA